MVSAVVLAAGESKRMGKKKELLPIGGEPMIARTELGQSAVIAMRFPLVFVVSVCVRPLPL